jgi:hypothetical protein
VRDRTERPSTPFIASGRRWREELAGARWVAINGAGYGERKRGRHHLMKENGRGDRVASIPCEGVGRRPSGPRRQYQPKVAAPASVSGGTA